MEGLRNLEPSLPGGEEEKKDKKQPKPESNYLADLENSLLRSLEQEEKWRQKRRRIESEK